MQINQQFEFVKGPFDTETGELVCVQNSTHTRVDLCFKANMNIPFAQIKLFDDGLYVSAKATINDAYALGQEICKRWNSFKK